MNVLLAFLHLLAGAILAGMASSSAFCVMIALAGLLRGRFNLLGALIWPALVWWVLLPLSLMILGMIADEWGHKTQVFMLVTLGVLGIPGVIMSAITGAAAGWMKPDA